MATGPNPGRPALQRARARVGTKLTIAAGMLLAGAGLWQISGATTSTYGGIVLATVLLGAAHPHLLRRFSRCHAGHRRRGQAVRCSPAIVLCVRPGAARRACPLLPGLRAAALGYGTYGPSRRGQRHLPAGPAGMRLLGSVNQG